MTPPERPDRRVILGIAETALMALCEQQVRASLGEPASVQAIRSTIEASVYWPPFTAAVHRGNIGEHHPDLPRGPLGTLLTIWAEQAPEAEGSR